MPEFHKNWLKAPLYVAALATSAKSFRDNPIIGNADLNRAGLHVARLKLAHAMAEWRRRRLEHLIDAEDLAAFKENGFILKQNFLPRAKFKAAREEIFSYQGPLRQMSQGDTITRRIAIDKNALTKMPATGQVIRSRQWLGLVQYVGSSALEPAIYLQSILSHACQGAPDPQTRLHADTFQPTVKAWLFLNDVPEDQGPFVYVPGSHLLTKRRLAWERRMSISAASNPDFLSSRGSFRISLEEVHRLGFPTVKAFAVPENTLVVADTFGFHARGPSVQPSIRTEIWAYGRRNPFIPWTGWDPSAFPPIKGHAVPFYLAAMDMFERRGIGRNPWRFTGIKTIEGHTS